MKTNLLIALALAATLSSSHAGWLDKLLGTGATNSAVSATTLSALSNDQMVGGLKEALGNGLQHAVSQLGHDGGFLTNLNVKIPMPEKLQTVEKTLRALGQNKLVDEFVTTLNHAAEQAVPEAAVVFGDAVKQMSITDAKAVLTGPKDSATQFFRRTTQTNLYAKFRPIVEKATAKTGATASYKNMLSKAGGSSLGGALGGFLGQDALDLDHYVTEKSLDGLFKMVADEEKKIRENPAARTTDLLKQVFGSVAK